MFKITTIPSTIEIGSFLWVIDEIDT